jgi:hypothetical protein
MDQPNVNAKISTRQSRNSISNCRSAMSFGCRISRHNPAENEMRRILNANEWQDLKKSVQCVELGRKLALTNFEIQTEIWQSKKAFVLAFPKMEPAA